MYRDGRELAALAGNRECIPWWPIWRPGVRGKSSWSTLYQRVPGSILACGKWRTFDITSIRALAHKEAGCRRYTFCWRLELIFIRKIHGNYLGTDDRHAHRVRQHGTD